MDAAAHLLMAMRDRPDRMASALWDWLQQYHWTIEQLTAYLDCSTATLERLALVPRPRPGADWEDDVEIIAVSLRLNHDALRAILGEHEASAAREFGA
jgi:hypothetical protein